MAVPLREEREWARKYPVPNSDPQDIVLTLWNYPVAKTDLTPEHRAALMKFLAGDFLEVKLSRRTETILYVTGHASDSGEAGANENLARDRAQKVARFLIGEGFPASQLNLDSRGSSEPIDSGSYGYAAARNRRVEVLRFDPPDEGILPPIGTDPPPTPDPDPEPGFKIPKALVPSSATIDIPIEFDLPPLRYPDVIIGGKIGGVLKLKVDDKGGGWGGGAVIKDGKLTAKFEKKLTDELKGKISFEPKSSEKAAVLKVGGEFKMFGNLDTTVGLQSKLPTFVYCEFTFEAARLPDIELGDVHVSMTLKPTLKLEIGPGPALVARAAPYAAAAGTTVAVVLGSVLFSALLIAGMAKVVDNAKQESLATTRLLAKRTGVAARVAWEVSAGANAGRGEVEFGNERGQWLNTLDAMGPSFDAGAKSVDALLRKGPRDELRAAWTTKYGAGSTQFEDVKNKILENMGPYQKGDETEDPASRL